MKGKWLGLLTVAVIAAAIIGYKSHETQKPPSAAQPRVVLVADLSEANASGDACALIIQDVRAARARGVAVEELTPNSNSKLLSRYHVMTVPTVLILNGRGSVVARYEGESRQTVAAVRSQLKQLQ